MPRGAAPPPQFDGRGAQQVLDAAPDRAASLRGHRAVSCPASCLSQRLELFSVALSSATAAAAVMLSVSRAVPGRSFQLAWLRFWFWTVLGHRLRFRCCSASYFSAAAKTRSGFNSTQTGLSRLTHRSVKTARGNDTNTSGQSFQNKTARAMGWSLFRITAVFLDIFGKDLFITENNKIIQRID